MKLSDFIRLAKDKGFLAADKKPEDLEAAVRAQLAQDGAEHKEAMDKAMDKRAADRKARDEKRAADRKARDKARDEKRAADRKARDEKCAADRKARDEKFGEDAENDPEGTNDEEMRKEAEDEAREEAEAEDSDNPEADPSTAAHGGGSKKPAVDSATVDARIAAAVAAERERNEALAEARREVEPILGVVTMDSAPAVYRAALTKIGVDHKGVADSALAPLLKVAKDRASVSAPAAQDADSLAETRKLIPNYNRL